MRESDNYIMGCSYIHKNIHTKYTDVDNSHNVHVGCGTTSPPTKCRRPSSEEDVSHSTKRERASAFVLLELG